MASLFIAITFLAMLFLIAFPPAALSQDPMTPGPTITDCASGLLTLTPCAPFVQGAVQTPVQPCCDNLKQQPAGCLCLLLNDTTLTAFPINRTLALELPHLCNIQADISTCSGVPVSPPPSSSSGSQVSLGSKTKSSVAASPVVQVAPRPNIMGFGLGRSAAAKLKMEDHLAILAVAAFLSAILLI